MEAVLLLGPVVIGSLLACWLYVESREPRRPAAVLCVSVGFAAPVYRDPLVALVGAPLVVEAALLAATFAGLVACLWVLRIDGHLPP